YGQRWQGETVFSMIKRRLATAVQGRTYWSQCRELWLLAITHNLMILYAIKGFLHSTPDPFFAYNQSAEPRPQAPCDRHDGSPHGPPHVSPGRRRLVRAESEP